MRGIFVTGTDTNVGKSVVSAAVMVRYQTLAPHYWKPVQTGIEIDDDTATVRRLARGCEVVDRGVRLPRPLSPHLSARFAPPLTEVRGGGQSERSEAMPEGRRPLSFSCVRRFQAGGFLPIGVASPAARSRHFPSPA